MAAIAKTEDQLNAATDKMEGEELSHHAFMHAASSSAMAGVALKHGGPFGAAVVRNGVILSCSHNMVLEKQDPTCHAEVVAIRDACNALQSHDLSDSVLYTTCEPCPQCLGAIRWARIKKIVCGVDRVTAAEFGFDDKVFYDELEAQSGHWSVKLGSTMPDLEPSMLNVYYGVGKETVERLLCDLELNKTYRRRIGTKELGFHSTGERFGKDMAAIKARESSGSTDGTASDSDAPLVGEATPSENLPNKSEMEPFFTVLEEALREASKNGTNKEREVFAACVVKDGEVVSVGVNEVLLRRDPTATAEVLAIRKACEKLKTYDLSGCTVVSTIEPCLMSLGALLWARVDALYYGASQHAAACHGFEEGLMHYREVLCHPEKMHEVIGMEFGVASDVCANVFRRWKEINGIIY